MPVDHIAYGSGTLRLLDQTKLPGATEFIELHEWPQVGRAIEEMRVRGAPAIGIAGAYGMALAARQYADRPDFLIRVMHAAAGLSKARPTAVNLSWAVNAVLDEVRALHSRGASSGALVEAAEQAARKIHDDDVAACRRIGDAGAELLASGTGILTLCNTGSLATGGYGTALGVIRSAWRDGKLKTVFVAETRPLLQGARLTAWELAQDGIPFSLIADSMAAHFAARGDVTAIVVGADRIARNGDVANKIGTLGFAVIANAFGIPFIVAAPTTTIDVRTPSGSAIPIEHRDPREITELRGVHLAPPETHAENPAFDVTPARLITAIVTERGALRPPFDRSIASAVSQPQEAPT